MSEYGFEPDGFEDAGPVDDFGPEDPWAYEPESEVNEPGERWRAATGAREVLEQSRLAAEAVEAITSAQRAAGRMGSVEAVAEAVNQAQTQAATEMLAMGYTPTQIREVLQDPAAAQQLLDGGIESAHWGALTQRMKNSVNPRGEAYKRQLYGGG